MSLPSPRVVPRGRCGSDIGKCPSANQMSSCVVRWPDDTLCSGISPGVGIAIALDQGRGVSQSRELPEHVSLFHHLFYICLSVFYMLHLATWSTSKLSSVLCWVGPKFVRVVAILEVQRACACGSACVTGTWTKRKHEDCLLQSICICGSFLCSCVHERRSRVAAGRA